MSTEPGFGADVGVVVEVVVGVVVDVVEVDVVEDVVVDVVEDVVVVEVDVVDDVVVVHHGRVVVVVVVVRRCRNAPAGSWGSAKTVTMPATNARASGNRRHDGGLSLSHVLPRFTDAPSPDGRPRSRLVRSKNTR